jgi:hypothetical protein
MRTLRRTLPAAALAALLLLCDGAPAQKAPAGRGEYLLPRVGMRVSLDVLVDGRPMRPVSHRGKTWLPETALM